MAALLIIALLAIFADQNSASGSTFLSEQEKDARVARCEALGYDFIIVRTFELYPLSVTCKESLVPVAPE